MDLRNYPPMNSVTSLLFCTYRCSTGIPWLEKGYRFFSIWFWNHFVFRCIGITLEQLKLLFEWRLHTVEVDILIPVYITNILSNKIPQNDIKEMSHKCPTDLKKRLNNYSNIQRLTFTAEIVVHNVKAINRKTTFSPRVQAWESAKI